MDSHECPDCGLEMLEDDDGFWCDMCEGDDDPITAAEKLMEN